MDRCYFFMGRTPCRQGVDWQTGLLDKPSRAPHWNASICWVYPSTRAQWMMVRQKGLVQKVVICRPCRLFTGQFAHTQRACVCVICMVPRSRRRGSQRWHRLFSTRIADCAGSFAPGARSAPAVSQGVPPVGSALGGLFPDERLRVLSPLSALHSDASDGPCTPLGTRGPDEGESSSGGSLVLQTLRCDAGEMLHLDSGNQGT